MILFSSTVKLTATLKCGEVHITVSSLKDVYLELNWITDCNQRLDTLPSHIALYDVEPENKVNVYVFSKMFRMYSICNFRINLNLWTKFSQRIIQMVSIELI